MIPLRSNDEVGLEAPTMVMDDQEDFHDPTLDALRVLLEANATRTYLESLTLEGRQTEMTNQITIHSPPEQDGSWKHAKSQRNKKSTLKTSKGSLGNRAC
ncbi:hypothetical protein Nepgr_030946 [Nepenthes gracilis]|uniref:Uncharacterized protein n=1 Tax=Nepenthes gracilis TaxID=150966 RepID=A0AAD3TFQ5_NEPGR|nr:hypothetical protein Nepgr_030946 [Nepenthes gracilis]